MWKVKILNWLFGFEYVSVINDNIASVDAAISDGDAGSCPA